MAGPAPLSHSMFTSFPASTRVERFVALLAASIDRGRGRQNPDDDEEEDVLSMTLLLLLLLLLLFPCQGQRRDCLRMRAGDDGADTAAAAVVVETLPAEKTDEDEGEDNDEEGERELVTGVVSPTDSSSFSCSLFGVLVSTSTCCCGCSFIPLYRPFKNDVGKDEDDADDDDEEGTRVRTGAATWTIFFVLEFAALAPCLPCAHPAAAAAADDDEEEEERDDVLVEVVFPSRIPPARPKLTAATAVQAFTKCILT